MASVSLGRARRPRRWAAASCAGRWGRARHPRAHRHGLPALQSHDRTGLHRRRGYGAIISCGNPVRIGGVTVAAGDIVFGDNDGVTVIQPPDLIDVIDRATAIAPSIDVPARWCRQLSRRLTAYAHHVDGHSVPAGAPVVEIYSGVRHRLRLSGAVCGARHDFVLALLRQRPLVSPGDPDIGP